MISCSGDEPARAASIAKQFRVGVSLGAFGSTLLFDTIDVAVERRAASAIFDWRVTPTTTLSFGAGAGLGGRFTVEKGPGIGAHIDILPGWLVTAAWARRLLDGSGKAPFLLLSLSAGASGASTRASDATGAAPLYAIDLRAGVTVGKTFWNTLSPYVAARAFGGPVFWSYRGDEVSGTDKYHFQLAAGLVTALPGGFDVFVDGVPLGERGLSLGAGKSF